MLQILNSRIDELLDRLAALRGGSRDEIVLKALEREWELAQKDTSLEDRLRPLQDFVASHPKSGLSADKAFFDDLNGDP